MKLWKSNSRNNFKILNSFLLTLFSSRLYTFENRKKLAEESLMIMQVHDLEKGRLIGSGAFGSVYQIKYKPTGGIYAAKVSNFIPPEAILLITDISCSKKCRSIDWPEERSCCIVSFAASKYCAISGSVWEQRRTSYSGHGPAWWQPQEGMSQSCLPILFPNSVLHILLIFFKVLQNRFQETEKGFREWFTERELIGWGVQILKGLQYLHSHNIAHRDIKVSPEWLLVEDYLLSSFLQSENIMVRYMGVDRVNSLSIADFGVSIVCDSENFKATTCAGTPVFMVTNYFPTILICLTGSWSVAGCSLQSI